MNNVIFESNNIEWSTPEWLFKELNDEFGFDLDACASDENHKCLVYYTKENDSLTKDWGGHTVFCNPPYGRKYTPLFVKKCYEESLKPGTVVVALIPARTDTQWFHHYVYGKAEIRFVKGRLKFGGSKNNAPFPSMVVIWR